MEDRKLIPNSTQIPNILLDKVIPFISEAEGKCLLYICRRTYGFHKERDRISLSQFSNGIKDKNGEILDNGTGISRPAVVEALKNLVGSGLIKVLSTYGGKFYEIDLSFNDFDEVVKKVNQLRKLTRTSKESLPKQVKLLNPQKKGNKEKQSINSVHLLTNYFFELKGWADKSKNFYQKNKVVYSRFTRPAKELLGLCDGNVEEAKSCLKKVADWAMSRELDWSIETIFKKWYDLDILRPKEKKPYYRGNRVFEIQGKKFVLMPNGEKMEFADKESLIEYK